jgi:hypothetical protein
MPGLPAWIAIPFPKGLKKGDMSAILVKRKQELIIGNRLPLA